MFKCTLLSAVVVGSVVPVAFAQESTHVIAFTHVNVVPLDSPRIEPDQIVLVRGDRIVALGAARDITVPADAVMIDGAGQYLVPGLTDAHVHLEMGMPWAQLRPDFADAPLYLSYGVTTVFNMGGTPTGTPAILDWRKRIEAGALLGPTIYTAGPFVNEPRVTTPEDVERDVVEQAQHGYDFIKFHEVRGTTTGLSLPAYRRMVDTAERLHLPVIGHAPINLGLDEALRSRQSLAHVGMLSNLYFLPLTSHLVVLLVTMVTFVAVVVLAAWIRKWRLVLAGVTIAAIVCLVLGLPAGPLFESTLVRMAFSVLTVAVATLGAMAMVSATRAWQNGTGTKAHRIGALMVALSAAVLAVALLAFWMPVAWRSSNGGINDVARAVRESGIVVDSTLVVYATLNRNMQRTLVEDRAIQFLTRPTRDIWRAQPQPLVSLSYLSFMEKVVGALHRAGVPIMAGTDAMGLPLVAPGSSLQRELALLAASGLSPYEVMRSATVVPAAFLGKNNQFGTIAPGQRADLLLVGGNPFERLGVLESPSGVMVRGIWLPRQRLDEMLKPLAR
jgi:imidazolonepropionase-like amidohydrolase